MTVGPGGTENLSQHKIKRIHWKNTLFELTEQIFT